MGLLRAELIELAKILNNIKKPSVLMIGKQDIIAQLYDIKQLMEEFCIQFDYSGETEDDIDAYKFFYALGAKEVHALDFSDYEGADIIFDLNSTEGMPSELYEHYDLVIDGGVLEHIFRPDVGIKNISNMVKPQGYIYHMLPCGGLINHGFYSFSPMFFTEYYQYPFWIVSNIRLQYKPERGMYKFVFYSMDCRFFLNQEGFNKYVSNYWNHGGEIMIQCICQKQITGGISEVPIQDVYKKLVEE